MFGTFSDKSLQKYNELVSQQTPRSRKNKDVQGMERSNAYAEIEDFTEVLRPLPLPGGKG